MKKSLGIDAPNHIYSIAFSPDGKWLATAGYEGTILLWEVNLTVPGWSVEPTGKLPGTWSGVKRAKLLQNFPNPFNPETWIPYQLGKDSVVAIKICASSGQRMRTLELGHKSAGLYTVKTEAAHWDGSNESGEPVASGIYFYTIQADDYTATKKMILAK
jgi:WD40 repeat protein